MPITKFLQSLAGTCPTAGSRPASCNGITRNASRSTMRDCPALPRHRSGRSNVKGTENVVTKKNNKVKRIRVAHRDDKMCGVHLGGCMMSIQGKSTLDHIIPQSLIQAFGLNSQEFNKDWNLQVMHPECNVKCGGAIHGLPCFQCACHYYEVVGENLYVLYQDGQMQETNLLMENFVIQHGPDPTGLSIRVEPISQTPKSWPKTKTLNLDSRNTPVHYVISITPPMVQEFNHREAERVRLIKQASQGRGPTDVVYLSQKYNQNFRFSPNKAPERANLNPFPFH